MGKILFFNNSETTLLARLRKNDSEAQRLLFDTYHKKLLSICFRYLRDEESAFDALNRSFLKIFEKIHQYKAEAKLEIWLKRIVINTCLDFLKNNKNYRQTFIQTNEFNTYGETDSANNDITDWWEEAVAIPSENIIQFIEDLPPATRTVFNLFAIDGYTHVQISEKLKISLGTSKWHLNHARGLLKEKITELIKKKLNHETRATKNS